MRINKLLVAAVLGIAIAAPIAGFVGELGGQPMTSTGVRVPFLHGFPIDQNAGQTELASLERANEAIAKQGLRAFVAERPDHETACTANRYAVK